MNFTCEGCFQNSTCQSKYTCKKYSSWLKHLSGPDHNQWSMETFHKCTARECDSSIVIVILPSSSAKKMFKLHNKDIIDAFISDGIIQNVFVDRSGNFAGIQFDDVLSSKRLQKVKDVYVTHGCQEQMIQDRNVLLFPRSAAVFNEATWKFLKQNHDVKRIKQTLAPHILNEPKNVVTSSESPEHEIVPLKSNSAAPVEVVAGTSSKGPKTDVPTVSSKIRVFVNSNFHAAEVNTALAKQQPTEPSQPSTIPNPTSLNGIRLLGSESEDNIERLVQPNPKMRLSKRQRSNSSTSGEEQQRLSSNAKVLPVQKRSSNRGSEEGSVTNDVIAKAISKLAGAQIAPQSNLSTVNQEANQIADLLPQSMIITDSLPLQQQQAGPIVPVPVFRPQPFPMTGSPVKPTLNPFFPPRSRPPPHPAPRQVVVHAHTVPVPPGLVTSTRPPAFLPGMRMGMMGQRPPVSQSPFVQPMNSNIPPIPGVLMSGPIRQDFYQLFAQLSRSGSEKRLSKDEMKKMTDHFLKLSLDQQMYSFNAATTVTPEELRTRGVIVAELQGYLKVKFPKSKVYVFGSMTTHLCGTDSDIDVVVDLYEKLDTESGTEKTIIRSVQKYLETIKGSKKNRSLYNIQPILQARVPILKMIHQETKIHLDLSFENFMSVRNSHLILLYMRLDSRIGPLMILIRYFAKFHELSGSFVIKNYAFLLLVVNYMCHKKYVPTIEQLQQWHDPSKDPHCIIDGWNTGFCVDPEYIQIRFGKPLFTQPPNWADVLDLVYGFFKMYSELDYENRVICPLIGDTLPRELFQPGHEEALPPCMERYKIYTSNQNLEARFRITSALKLQDPFHLQFNVGSITPAYVLFSFRILCVNMVETLHNFRTIKKRVPTIIDLLQRLPVYVSEKECYNLQQAAKQRIWLSHELSLVFGDDDDEEVEFDASIVSRVIEPSNSSEVPDLWLVKKLVDIGKSTAHYKCGNLEFDIGRRFCQFFAQNSCQIEELSDPDQIINQAKLLWAHFVMDYLGQIWSTGFQMGISMRVKWTAPPELPTESILPGKTLGFNSADAVHTPNTETKMSSADQAVIVEKLEELAKNYKAGEVYYFKMTTTGTKLFYHGRKTISRKLLKAIQQTDESGNNNSQTTVITLPKKKKQLELNVNPIEFEGRVTTAVLENVTNNNKAQNGVTKLKAYGKLDLKLDEDDVSPVLHLAFRKLEKGISLEAFDTVVKTIRDTFPNYVIYRLLQFFKAFGPEETKTQDYPAVDFGLEEESEDEKGNSSEREEETGDDVEFPIDNFQNILDA